MDPPEEKAEYLGDIASYLRDCENNEIKPPTQQKQKSCIHNTKPQEFVELTTIILVLNYEILIAKDGHAEYLEMLTGQEYSRLIIVAISHKAG